MALGMAIAAVVAHWRYTKKHPGSTDIVDIFLPTVIAGIFGARLYHLFTGYDWSSEGLSGIIKLRNGGLSIWGAVIAGAIAVFIMAKIKKASFWELGEAIIPGLLLAQAVGRFGNYFNQELFGRPLHAFWALKVDQAYRPSGYESVATFHPTFLYEALWCIFLAVVVILLENKVQNWPRGATVATYIFGYCAGRAYFEWLRTDKATHVFGVRFNLLLSIVLSVCGLIWLLVLLRSRPKVRAKIDSQ
jgi:prolipoprotein diacylglyceryl transferase